MKALIATLAASALVLSAVGSADAQPQWHGDSHGGSGPQQHQGGGQHGGWGQDRGGGHHWQRGERMGYNDWRNAPPVDYRAHHLRRPPRGYEWRESNGQYVLAAVATGLIASIILNSH